MHPFWHTRLGKLVMGGCGAQVGLLVTLSFLGVTLLFCSVCLMANVLSLGLTQEMVGPNTSAQTRPMPEEIALLQQKVDLLTGKVIAVRANAPYLPTPTPLPPPPPPRPIVLAHTGGVNLRSGPSDEYFKVGRMAKGESLEIVGRNANSSWWLVMAPGGALAWVSNEVVSTYNITANIPVVTIPGLLVQPGGGSAGMIASSAPVPVPAVVVPPGPGGDAPPAVATLPDLGSPAGTPTAPASVSRRFVQDTLGYKQVIRRLLLPTVSESFSPDGTQIAITEKISLYTITTDGANPRVLLEDDDKLDLVGGVIWSPDGGYLAFVANRLGRNCNPCQTVGLVRLGDGQVMLFDPQPGLSLDQPRWTQDGRLLVNARRVEPDQGTVFVYDTAGQGQPAAGSFLLSSSHDGQKWFPWQPGRVWQADAAGQGASYYGDE